MTEKEPRDAAFVQEDAHRADDPKEALASDSIVDGLLRAAAARKNTKEFATSDAVMAKIRTERQAVGSHEKIVRPDFGYSGLLVRCLTVIAACLVVALGMWWVSENMLVQPVATLSGNGPVTVQRGKRSINVSGNTRLYSRDVLVTGEGANAVIVYHRDSTRIALRGGSSLEIGSSESGKQLVLNNGSMTAEVAQQPKNKPMIVKTPQAEIRVTGTRFLLRTDSAGSALEVTEGAVRVARHSDDFSIKVPEGYAVALSDMRTPSLFPLDRAVMGHMRKEQISELDKSLKLARAFAVDTVTYAIDMDQDTTPDELKAAVTAAHQSGLLVFARVDLRDTRLAGLSEAECTAFLKQRLTSLIQEYDLDGVYLSNATMGRNEAQLADLLNPVYEHIGQAQPGAALMIGYPSDSNT